MTAKRKWVGIVLTFVLATVLCGCGTPEKTADEIKVDLTGNMSQLTERKGTTLQSVEITKRQTDREAKIDTVYVNFSMSTDDGVAEGTGSCVMTYGLYNEGWILDSLEAETVEFVPLKGVEYSEGEIKDMAWSKYGADGTLAEFRVVSQDTTLEHLQDGYTVSMKIEHKYMTELVEFGVGFWFDQMNGMWYEGPAAVRNKEEIWDIEGNYTAETLIHPKRLLNEYATGDTSAEGNYWDYIDMSSCSKQEFWGSIVPRYYDSYFTEDRLQYVIKNRFEVNFDWNRYEFCLMTGNPEGTMVFVGKDDISWCNIKLWTETDMYRRETTIGTRPMNRIG